MQTDPRRITAALLLSCTCGSASLSAQAASGVPHAHASAALASPAVDAAASGTSGAAAFAIAAPQGTGLGAEVCGEPRIQCTGVLNEVCAAGALAQPAITIAPATRPVLHRSFISDPISTRCHISV
jgi:hypothetical protein